MWVSSILNCPYFKLSKQNNINVTPFQLSKDGTSRGFVFLYMRVRTFIVLCPPSPTRTQTQNNKLWSDAYKLPKVIYARQMSNISTCHNFKNKQTNNKPQHQTSKFPPYLTNNNMSTSQTIVISKLECVKSVIVQSVNISKVPKTQHLDINQTFKLAHIQYFIMSTFQNCDLQRKQQQQL